MPKPHFTELTFGYAYLRELERRYAGGAGFPLAPDFISQNVEADLGYDVEVALDGAAPLFVQLKRSDVMTRKTAREIADHTYPGPRVYRMHLHRPGKFRQHKALQRLQAAGHEVQYVTSQIYTRDEFNSAFSVGQIVSQAAAHFLPLEIVLPNDTEEHHVSFKAEDWFGYVYSKEPVKFERSIATFDAWAPRLRERRRSAKENLESLSNAVETMEKEIGRLSRLRRLIADRPVEQQASILAYLVLDAQLTFVRDN